MVVKYAEINSWLFRRVRHREASLLDSYIQQHEADEAGLCRPSNAPAPTDPAIWLAARGPPIRRRSAAHDGQQGFDWRCSSRRSVLTRAVLVVSRKHARPAFGICYKKDYECMLTFADAMLTCFLPGKHACMSYGTIQGSTWWQGKENERGGPWQTGKKSRVEWQNCALPTLYHVATDLLFKYSSVGHMNRTASESCCLK
jgi:hypothetical protein